MVTSKTNAPARSAPDTSRRRHNVVPANEFHREHHERREQHQRQDRLQPVDQLIADESDHALHTEHNHDGDPERDAEQHRQRLRAEQPGERDPGDRREPLQNGRQHDTSAEGHPRVRQLTGPRARPPCRKVGDERRTQHRAGRHREQPQPEAQAQHDRQRAAEYPCHADLRCEPHGEEPGGRAVPLVLCDGCDAVRLDRQVTRAAGTVAGEGRCGQRAREALLDMSSLPTTPCGVACVR